MALIDNLISYWKLNETSGTRNDSFSSNHLSDINTVGSATGILGNASTHNGLNSSSGNHLKIVDNAAVSSGDIDFTIAVWVKATALGAAATFNGIVSKWDPAGGSQKEYQIYHSGTNNRFIFNVSGNGTATQGITANNFGAASTGVWYFIVAWHDSVNNTLNICVNNGTVDSVSYSLGVFNSTSPFLIGAFQETSWHWNGAIDEVGLWKRVLTSTERTQLYNGGAGLAYPFTTGILRHVMAYH